MSYLSDLHGLVCDNVVNYEVCGALISERYHSPQDFVTDAASPQVILGNGSLVNANADINMDLFWALKGGANNFGTCIA